MRKRTEAQKEAERVHRAKTVQVQVRFSKEEGAQIAAIRGEGVTNTQWLRTVALEAMKAARARS